MSNYFVNLKVKGSFKLYDIMIHVYSLLAMILEIPHYESVLHSLYYTFVVSRAIIAGAAGQA